MATIVSKKSMMKEFFVRGRKVNLPMGQAGVFLEWSKPAARAAIVLNENDKIAAVDMTGLMDANGFGNEKIHSATPFPDEAGK